MAPERRWCRRGRAGGECWTPCFTPTANTAGIWPSTEPGPLRMNGLTVILQAARKIPSSITEVLGRQNISAQQVAVFLLHQANLNLLTRVAKSLGVGPEKVFANVQRYGNTSSASMLIAASEWSETNSEPGPVVFSAFGAGFHWGALVADSVS